MVSFNATVRQMTEMFQRKKNRFKVRLVLESFEAG